MSEETILWSLRWNKNTGLDFVEERKVSENEARFIRDLFESEEPNVMFIVGPKKPKAFILYEK